MHVHDREALISVTLALAILGEAKTWTHAGFLSLTRLLGMRPMRPLQSLFLPLSLCAYFCLRGLPL
jgi:hypothetical protein